MRIEPPRAECLVALAIPLLSGVGYPSVLSGPVVSVLDGDTIEVLHNGRAERICLSGIDCPEKGQAYGNNAKHAASKLVFGKGVTLQTHGKDKYGRTLGDVILLDGTTSITRSLRAAGAGGIGSMRREIWHLNSWRRKHERLGRPVG